MLQTTREALLGRRIDDMVPPERTAALGRAWETFLEAGTQTGVIEICRADGRPLRIEYAARANVLPGRHISTMRDVTERLRLEEQQRQAQKLETVGLLTGGIAHDFNNLLTAIVGYTTLLLQQTPRDSPAHGDLEEVMKAAAGATALTSQLLAFGRRQVLRPSVVDLNQVLRHMEGVLRRVVPENVELALILAPDLLRTRADRSQLEQILLNLVSNGGDAMPLGGTLRIETANAVLEHPLDDAALGAGPGEYVRLAVSDTGCGMDAATRERIFEPFFSTRSLGRGTGLGLATVDGIVRQSEGHIGVWSEPGQGTTFTVYLPALPAAPAGEPAVGAPSRP
jgi:signal transduction histidine kinase